MMIRHLVSVDANGVVQGSAHYDDEIEGAFESLTLVPGETFMEVDKPFVRDRNHVAVLKGRSVEWEDVRPLEEIQTEAISDVDHFADAARLMVVGDAARIKEYEDAQQAAESYRDAGYTGTVPEPVAAWAYAKRRNGWTPQQAADDILAASARWYAALRGIRRLRLDAKEAIRFASTSAEVDSFVATFRATLTAAMKGVQ